MPDSVAGSSSMLRPPSTGPEPGCGNRCRQPGRAVAAAAAPPTSPARFRKSRRSIVIGSPPRRLGVVLAAIGTNRQGAPVRFVRCPAPRSRSIWPRPRSSWTSTARSARATSGVHLLERLGAPRAGATSTPSTTRARSAAGSACSTSGTCSRTTRTLLREVAAEVPLDPDLDGLVAGLRAAGAEVSVVSDGFGFYATERCAHLGIPVLTNAVDWSAGRLEFPNEDRCCACSSCGTCKQAPIKDAPAPGPVHGDGGGRHERPQGCAARRRGVRQGCARARWCARECGAVRPVRDPQRSPRRCCC